MKNPRKVYRQEDFPVPDDVVDTAIDWSLKICFNTPDEDTRRAFEAWLESDSRHVEAWRQMQSAQEGFDALPVPHVLNILEKVSEKRRSRGISRRNVVKMGVLGGIFLMTGWRLQKHLPTSRETLVAGTQIGGRRTLQLSEGTVVELNTDTALRAEFTKSWRRIHLLRGEVLITTGKDAGSTCCRPFWVKTPFGPLEALGTRFTVRLTPDSTRISVLEGAVGMGTGNRSVAHAGETWLLNSRDARQIADPVLGALDWVDGVIVAKRMPLPDFLAELSRYRTGKIVWDSRVANLKISGVYHIQDPDKALMILSQSLPVVLTTQAKNRIHVGPLPHSASYSESKK